VYQHWSVQNKQLICLIQITQTFDVNSYVHDKLISSPINAKHYFDFEQSTFVLEKTHWYKNNI
jgi:hypothetical protein